MQRVVQKEIEEMTLAARQDNGSPTLVDTGASDESGLETRDDVAVQRVLPKQCSQQCGRRRRRRAARGTCSAFAVAPAAPKTQVHVAPGDLAF